MGNGWRLVFGPRTLSLYQLQKRNGRPTTGCQPTIAANERAWVKRNETEIACRWGCRDEAPVRFGLTNDELHAAERTGRCHPKRRMTEMQICIVNYCSRVVCGDSRKERHGRERPAQCCLESPNLPLVLDGTWLFSMPPPAWKWNRVEAEKRSNAHRWSESGRKRTIRQRPVGNTGRCCPTAWTQTVRPTPVVDRNCRRLSISNAQRGPCRILDLSIMLSF